MVYAFLMTKGGQQVPQPKSKAKARARSREMMSEGAEQTPDVSPPRPPLERPPIVFVRGETLEPSTARPKVRKSMEKQTAKRRGDYWGPYARRTIFSSAWNQLHVFFLNCAEKFSMALCARMTRTYCFFKKKTKKKKQQEEEEEGGRRRRKEEEEEEEEWLLLG